MIVFAPVIVGGAARLRMPEQGPLYVAAGTKIKGSNEAWPRFASTASNRSHLTPFRWRLSSEIGYIQKLVLQTGSRRCRQPDRPVPTSEPSSGAA